MIIASYLLFAISHFLPKFTLTPFQSPVLLGKYTALIDPREMGWELRLEGLVGGGRVGVETKVPSQSKTISALVT